ncbi:uncharacterized protein LOC115764102 [Drosophila novamexicana]|uniref:uncharacterized protein LOC115764102 n=1 Tax=Drosophila novamexicana TaxID=47314 RepID=UPI0011E593D4|nr:uncharacterized protein LOC115764102 [Drosophila novamexicana]
MYVTPLAFIAIIFGYRLVPPIAAKTDFELQFENFTCIRGSASKANPLKSFHCGLSKNPKRRTMHMEFALLEPLNEHEFHMLIVIPRRTVDFVLLNVTTDGCQLLSNKNQVPLLRIARDILDRYSNFPRHCPFEQGKAYYMRGFRLDLSLIPAVMMETPVSVQFGYKRRQVQLFQGHIVAHVQRTSIAKKKKDA